MASPMLVTEWFWVPVPRPNAETRLFCFPHAGGDAPAFAELGRALPPDIEVWAVRLPGRGGRFTAPHATDVNELVHWVSAAMRPFVSGRYALLGQSLGALVAYNVGRELSSLNPPSACVLAALLPPNLWQGPPGPTGRQDVVSFLRSIDDSVTQILAHPDLSALLLSVVHADLNLCQDYVHRWDPPLSCPVLGLVGTDDPTVTGDQMWGWARSTTGPFSMRVLSGGHLVVQTAHAMLARSVSEFLSTPAGAA
ncbi:alpha/beta fold hydrolase [Streptosporangium sp. NPDC051022]|uniref:thioesterase II family protein n=1 Tax=Streptosporangium sp. NPDC051022 TaxID=3155752 RepID=UPI00342ACD7E